jgi:hypothetical protein
MDKRFFFASWLPDMHRGLPSLLLKVYRDSFLGVKRPGCEAKHLLPSSAEANNRGAIPPLPISDCFIYEAQEQLDHYRPNITAVLLTELLGVERTERIKVAYNY